ncbi:methyltransferase [Herminiimonas sp. KBW02]|uniref:methyltransferase n=1 Tax=Herminiimonas sp. KBW02 TaxID=2153363 RepID=UPI000F5B86FB|nr:class I SAM-dependent methyltransferase [Herminiimonas sp. KBW02]RQO38506.1 methyltransferase [Herminiimonas sp. KBW02]
MPVTDTALSTPALITWSEAGADRTARWQSESGHAAPKRVIIADDKLTADTAFRLASEGTALLWRGDYQNARQLLQALARRIERKPRKAATTPIDAFNFHRQAQSQRARTLGMVLLEVDADYSIGLRRAPDIKLACNEAYGASTGPFVLSLREVLGLIGAHEWRKNGVEIPALGARIHPYYGVFSPVRGEYLNLIADAPLPSKKLAFDIGTGTGVIAALLAQRGVEKVIATDQDVRALACAKENLSRLDLRDRVQVLEADLFPEGKAPLIVCNPPWIPARPSSAIEYAIYDPDSRMLRGFLNGLAAHLEAKGEGWLILSDLAEHLGLRTREELLQMIETAGLKVVARIDTKPVHPRAADASDPLHHARSAETTSLWRLVAR